MSAYYNEFDPNAAAWLRELIKQGHIADGVVDERSIEDVRPDELQEFTQCHFFAGIGVWSRALRLAGWPDNRPIWTGSCPCQPFSTAGKGSGFDDERHLWPHMHWLIQQCKPDYWLGEQVASKDGLGWFDLVQADMENAGYSGGSVDLCAAGVGAPHIRQRQWLGYGLHNQGVLGNSYGKGLQEHGRFRELHIRQREGSDPTRPGINSGVYHGRVANPYANGRNQSLQPIPRGASKRSWSGGQPCGLVDTNDQHQRPTRDEKRPNKTGGAGEAGGMANTTGDRRWRGGQSAEIQKGREPRYAERRELHERPEGCAIPDQQRAPILGVVQSDSALEVNGFWRDADWLSCRDGRFRPVRPGAFPLVNGAPARVVRLRGYGNAINAEAAKAFIEAFMGAIE